MDKLSEVPQVYALKSYYTDDFDMTRKLVEMVSYHWKMEGRVSNVLRSKLAILLTLYVKEGFSKKTKLKACQILGTNIAAINSMNLDLRQSNYLIKGAINSTENHLHEDLKLLKDYIEKIPSAVEAGTPLVMMLFQIKRIGEQ
jgi:hypothetical protein